MSGKASGQGWPRRGFPLIPRVLRRAWHFERLPPAALERAGLASNTTVGMLDRSVWSRVGRPEHLAPVANYLAHITTSLLYHGRNSNLASQALVDYPLPGSATLDDLTVSRRTRNALERGGRGSDLHWLMGLGAQDILALRGLGSRGLLDLICAMEGQYLPSDVLAAAEFAETGLAYGQAEAASESEEQAAAIPADVPRSRTSGMVAALDRQYPLADISTSDPRFEHLGLLGSSLSGALGVVPITLVYTGG